MGKTMSFCAVGDIMLGDHPICIGHGVGSSLRNSKNKVPIFNKIKKVFIGKDIIFGNLEAVMSDIDIDVNNIKSVQLRASEKSIDELTYAGFNILSLANNHILEHGDKSLKKTIDILRTNNILPLEIYKEKIEQEIPISFKKNGIKIGFIAYCLIKYNNSYVSIKNPSEIIDDVSKAKEMVDHLIVSLHWGNEFVRTPSLQQVKLGHDIIDAGARVIIGHHPHVLQGVEKYNGGIIAYSLGNFVFDMWQKEMRESMILTINFSKTSLDNFVITPIMIGSNYQPYLLENYKKDILIKKIKNDFLKHMDEDRYSYEVEKQNKKYRNELKKYLIKNIFKYKPKYSYQIITNYVKK